MKIINLEHIEKRSGGEQFSSGKDKLDFTLKDFLSWSYSDLKNKVLDAAIEQRRSVRR